MIHRPCRRAATSTFNCGLIFAAQNRTDAIKKPRVRLAGAPLKSPHIWKTLPKEADTITLLKLCGRGPRLWNCKKFSLTQIERTERVTARLSPTGLAQSRPRP